MRVLIVDDHEVSRADSPSPRDRRRHDVGEADDGNAARAMIGEVDPTLCCSTFGCRTKVASTLPGSSRSPIRTFA